MKSKWNVVATIIAICLITSASQAQSGSLKVRFHVPFPFTVENKTLAAGEYEVTQGSRRACKSRLPPLRQVIFLDGSL